MFLKRSKVVQEYVIAVERRAKHARYFVTTRASRKPRRHQIVAPYSPGLNISFQTPGGPALTLKPLSRGLET